MTAPEGTARATAAEAGTGNRARATLGTCGAAHFLHDGFSDVLYVLLPLWAQEFGLSLTQVGLLTSLYTGGWRCSSYRPGCSPNGGASGSCWRRARRWPAWGSSSSA